MKLQQRFNANHLKLIAIIAMTVDHVCDLVYPGFLVEPMAIGLHFVGRLTAPIMWFFVCEGFYYTHDAKKYMLRMGIFSVISHFAYCYALAGGIARKCWRMTTLRRLKTMRRFFR